MREEGVCEEELKRRRCGKREGGGYVEIRVREERVWTNE